MVREVVEARLVRALVARADAERPEAGQHVELGHREVRQRVEPRGVAQGDEVDPADAAGAAGRRAVLAAGLAHRRAELVVELGRERAGADAGGVRLGHAPDLVEVLRAGARARGGARRDRVRRRHERIRAVVDVEQRALRALEDDLPALVEVLPGEPRGVGDVLLDPVAVGQVVLGHALQVEVGRLGVGPQREALGLHRGHDLLLQDLLVEQVLDADAEAGGLVGVGGADAAPRRPDLQLAELRLARVVEQHVVRHDQVRVGADPQPGEVDALGPQVVELVGEDLRVDHDAVADRARLAGVEDPRRDQVELPLHAVADDRVAGVVAALEADDQIGVLGEQIGDLALALVAPLGADDDDPRHFAVQSTREAPYPPALASPYAGSPRSRSAPAARSGSRGAGPRRTSAWARRRSRTAARPSARRSGRRSAPSPSGVIRFVVTMIALPPRSAC